VTAVKFCDEPDVA